MLRHELQEQAEHCNKMKKSAKIAGVSVQLCGGHGQWLLGYLLLDHTCIGTEQPVVSGRLFERK